MKTVLLINGSPNEFGCTYTALKEVADVLNQNKIRTEILYLGKKPIADCLGCGKCHQTHRCIFQDDVNTVLDKIDTYDGIIAGSPVYYAGPSGRICSFLDRLFFCAADHGAADLMVGKLAAAVVSCRRGGASSAFDRLNKYFTIANMNVVGSQYWNQVHGTTPEEVRRDIEGMQTMRTLGQNMAWLLNNYEAGEKMNIPPINYEPYINTNFI